MPGLDGRKMSKSYNNVIDIRDTADVIETKVLKMQTDPSRGRRTDPGDPEKCPVWQMHEIYSDESTQAWVQEGCKTAAIGCVDCKRPIVESIQKELAPIRERAEDYVSEPDLVRNIIIEGSEVARDAAKLTMQEVRQAMGLQYR